jgi:hypothetical protein
MHRSGTGALARALAALGIAAIPEDGELAQLHDQVLDALGTTWHGVAPLDERWDAPALEGLRSRALGLARDRSRDRPLWVLADPRACRLLRFWQPVFQHLELDSRYALVYRNPIAVAHSLSAHTAGEIVAEHAHLLWLEHYLEALAGTSGRPRVVLDFDELIAAPASQLERLGRILDLGLPGARAESEAGLAQVIDPSRVHFTFDQADRDPALPELAVRCQALLEALALAEADRDDDAHRAELVALEAQWRAAAGLRRNLDQLAARERAARLGLQSAKGAMTYLEKQHHALRRMLFDKAADLEAERARYQAQLQELLRDQGTYGARIGRGITKLRRRFAPEGSLAWRAAAALGGAAGRVFGARLAPAPAPRSAPAATPAPAPQYAYDPQPRSLPAVLPLHVYADPGLAERPTLNVLVPGLTLRSMSGGPNTAFNISYRMAQRGVPVRYISTDVAMQRDLEGLWSHLHAITGIRERLPIVQFACGFDRKVPLPIGANDVFFATAWWTAQMVKHALPYTTRRRFLYLIQEFEPGLYPWSSEYALALETYGLDYYALINERLLAEHLCQERIGRFADPAFLERCAMFEPAIDRAAFHPEPKAPDRPRRLLFYARPVDARRNLFEMTLYALRLACEQGVFTGPWEMFFLGERLPDIELAPGFAIRSLRWMSFEDYAREMRAADVLVSMMLSPHTSYPPLEIAACGGIALTSEYSVKTADRLARISPSIIGVAPTVEGIVAGLRRAVNAPAPGGALRSPASWEEALGDTLPRAVQMFHQCMTDGRA